jgi:hypothetical protein
MRSHAKAATAGSTMHRARGFGRIVRGTFATRGGSSSAAGSSASSHGSPRIALLAALALTAFVAFPPALASAAQTDHLWSFGPDGTEATDFDILGSVALDQQDDLVYVLKEADSEASLFRFDADGDPVDFEGTNPDIEGNRLEGLQRMDATFDAYVNKIAVDSANGLIYVAQPSSVLVFESDGDPAEFTAGPGAGTSEIPGLGAVKGAAVDSNGSIYVSHIEGESGKVSVFESSGAPLTNFAVTGPRGVSVATDGAVYVPTNNDQFNQTSEALERFTPSGFPVSGGTTYSQSTFVSAPPSSGVFIAGVDVDRVNGDVYVLESTFNTTWIRRYDATGTLVESFGAPGTPTAPAAFGGGSAHIAVWAEVKEIVAGETVKLYLADQEFDQSKVAAVGKKIITGPPEILRTSVLDVTADSAKLRAWVDPNTAETTYYFEYGVEDCGTSVCTRAPLGEVSIAAGEDPVEVSQLVFDLQPDTTYHYRVVAENSFGPPVEGPSRTFTTQQLGLGFELIDSRAWEMVSPPKKFGGLIKSPLATEGGHLQAAANGDSLLYNTANSIEADPEGNRAIEDSSVLARRGGAGGWRSEDITPPHTTATPLAAASGREYKLFSLNLERALLEPRDATPHSPQASERTPYLRENDEPPTYTPLVTGKEGPANVPPGTEFGGDPLNFSGHVTIAGASPDLRHVVLKSITPLAPGATAGLNNESLYAWKGGQLSKVSVKPVSEGGATVAAQLGSGVASVRRAISDDGSRVFWSTVSSGSSNALYVRDMDREETVRLDVVQAGPGAGDANPVFQGANGEGTVALFTDSHRLSEDAGGAGRDLYLCEVRVEGGELGCDLTDLTAETAAAEESAEVQGLVSAMSDDATRAYFVAKGVLDSQPNGHGDSAVPGQPNLYRWQEGSGNRFIATLSEEDSLNWGSSGPLIPVQAFRVSAAASPGGRYLAFMSQGSLTGYDNRDARSGELDQEVFRYDAFADQLICASCNPTGANPVGLRGSEGLQQPYFDPQQLWQGRALAAVLPQATRLWLGGSSLYRSRAIHDNGRLFFNAADSLVPADSNGQWDVYQYEPTGTGDCSASSIGAATSRSAEGCVSLISSGADEEEAAFLDASLGGDDVFFYTAAQLSVTDEDQEVDIYDARVDGIPATLTPNAECLGEACQPAAIAPNDPTPASTSFKGRGNPKPAARKRCGKGKRLIRRKGKARCVVRQRARKGKAGKARKGKASKGRRASR